MANTKVTTNVIADDAITGAKIADDAINSEHYTDGSIDTAHIADDQVTLAKMAGLARGKIIYGDSSGNPAALAVGSNGQVLKSDGTDIAWGTDSTVAALTSEEVQDIVGAMFSSNTETGITATYQDADGTVDLVVGTLNQDTTGTAATVTGAAQTNITSLGTLTALTVDDITIDGSTISDGGTLTLDVASTLIIDADGGQISFRDGGTEIGVLENSSSDFQIESKVSDKDIKFVGSDDGSAVTALTLDMSEAGTATFNHDIKLGDNGQIILGAGSDFSMYHDGSNTCMNESGTGGLRISSSAVRMDLNSDTDYSSTGEPAGILTLYNSSGSDGAGVNNYSSLEFNTGDGATSQGFINYVRTADNQGSFAFSQRTGSSSYAEAMRIDNSGHLLVGKTSGTSGNKVETDGRVSAGAGSNSQPTFNCEGDTNTGINLPESDRIQFITGGSERARIIDSGLTFNGDTAAANALDDYEEGDWNPAILSGGSTNPTGGGNVAVQGHYVKIGRQVWVTFYTGRSWTNSPNGQLIITGLPFTATDNNDNIVHTPIVSYNVDGNGQTFAAPSLGNDYLLIYQQTSGAWAAQTWQSDSTSPIYLAGQLTYFV